MDGVVKAECALKRVCECPALYCNIIKSKSAEWPSERAHFALLRVGIIRYFAIITFRFN